MNNVNERDWKLFKEKLPVWQENYMEKLINEYMEILQEDCNPSEKFAKLYKRIHKDRHKVGVNAIMSKTEMFYNIISLINEGVITSTDLADFSDELNKDVKQIYENR